MKFKFGANIPQVWCVEDTPDARSKLVTFAKSCKFSFLRWNGSKSEPYKSSLEINLTNTLLQNGIEPRCVMLNWQTRIQEMVSMANFAKIRDQLCEGNTYWARAAIVAWVAAYPGLVSSRSKLLDIARETISGLPTGVKWQAVNGLETFGQVPGWEIYSPWNLKVRSVMNTIFVTSGPPLLSRETVAQNQSQFLHTLESLVSPADLVNPGVFLYKEKDRENLQSTSTYLGISSDHISEIGVDQIAYPSYYLYYLAEFVERMAYYYAPRSVALFSLSDPRFNGFTGAPVWGDPNNYGSFLANHNVSQTQYDAMAARHISFKDVCAYLGERYGI